MISGRRRVTHPPSKSPHSSASESGYSELYSPSCLQHDAARSGRRLSPTRVAPWGGARRTRRCGTRRCTDPCTDPSTDPCTALGTPRRVLHPNAPLLQMRTFRTETFRFAIRAEELIYMCVYICIRMSGEWSWAERDGESGTCDSNDLMAA